MSEPNQTFYRCRVSADMAAGHLLVGRRRCSVLVDEKSIDGFTIRISEEDLGNLRICRKVWILEHEGERSAVRPEWFLNHPSGTVQLGLRRLADLTPPPKMSGGLSVLISPRAVMRRVADCSEIWLGCAAVLLLMVLTLPGMGDYLGTAPRVRQGSSLLVRSFDGFFRGMFNN